MFENACALYRENIAQRTFEIVQNLRSCSNVRSSPETPTCEVPSNGVVEISILHVITGETSIQTRSSYREAVSTLYCALENGADLHVNERQKIQQYHARFTEERRIIRRVIIIESLDSISRDEPDSPMTQYITNAGISRARYTITLFKYHHRVLRLNSNRISV